MISVRPDPAHPRGGHAVLALAESAVAGETTQVAVYDNYSERYLGEAGWQPTKVLFGPYQITREGGEARLVIGPEIVNQIEEYANVRLEVGNTSHDVAWPDEVVPAPGAAKIGGILAAGAKDDTPKGTLTAQMPVDETPPKPEPTPLTHEPIPEPEEEKRSKSGLMIGLLVLVALAAAGAYWFLSAEEPEQIAEPEPIEEPAPVVVTADDPCTAEALRALEGFDAQLTALRGCGSKASADAALGVVERAAASGSAEALTLFGTVYDGQASAAVIEEQIGLTFGDIPATAAEYYSRAVAAGSEDAATRLQDLCTRMADMTDTLARGAVADYCSQ